MGGHAVQGSGSSEKPGLVVDGNGRTPCPESDPQSVEIHILRPDQPILRLDVNPSHTIEQLKETLTKNHKVSAKSKLLIYGEKPQNEQGNDDKKYDSTNSEELVRTIRQDANNEGTQPKQ